MVLDEAVLHRQVGGPAVMAGQLTALVEAGARPDVTLQVLPFPSALTPAWTATSRPRVRPPRGPPVAYVEGLMGDVYVEAAEEVDRFSLAWTHLVTQALSPADSAGMISALAKETLWPPRRTRN